jgi:tetratricopeptide (TPR) repeat protein
MICFPFQARRILLVLVALAGCLPAIARMEKEAASATEAPEPGNEVAAGKQEPAAAMATRGPPEPVAHASAANPLAAIKAAEARGLINLGGTLTERSDFSAAEIAFRQVLNSTEFSQSDQKDALLGLARMYRRQGSFTKAAAIYEKFLKEFPDEGRVPDALLDLGRTLRAMGAHRMAISRFYSVINSTLKVPANSFDHYQLLAKTAQFEIAETHFESGNFTEAGKFFARLRLLDLAPADQARAHFKSAYALQLAGEPEASITTLRAYLEQWPRDENVPEARYLLAITLRQLNRTEEALAATLELLRNEQANSEADPKRWAYWQRRTGNQLANEFFQSGDTINALAIYQGLAALAPDAAWRLPVTYQIALCYERLRLVDRARTAYQSIIDTAAEAAGNKTDGPVPADIAELSRMASWRMSNLEWSDRTDHQLTVFFSTSTDVRPVIKSPPAPANDAVGSPAATSTTVR